MDRHPFSRLGRRAALLATATVALAAPSASTASVVPARATMETGTFAGFSSTNQSTGLLSITTGDAYTGDRSASATYAGGGANGYTRGLHAVSWGQGDDVWYRSAFFLPVGFKASMQGQVALLRWDDWVSHPLDTDHGGVVIYGSSKRAYLVRERLTQNDQRSLVGPFDLPEGRWFQLEVHQTFGSGAGALSEVYLDGVKLGSSTSPNLDAGRTVERLRTGIVAIAAGAQLLPLSLRFDDATIATSGPAAPRPGTPTSTAPGTVAAPVPVPTSTVPGTVAAPVPVPTSTVPGTVAAPVPVPTSTVPGTVAAPVPVPTSTVPGTVAVPVPVPTSTVPGTVAPRVKKKGAVASSRAAAVRRAALRRKRAKAAKARKAALAKRRAAAVKRT